MCRGKKLEEEKPSCEDAELLLEWLGRGMDTVSDNNEVKTNRGTLSRTEVLQTPWGKPMVGATVLLLARGGGGMDKVGDMGKIDQPKAPLSAFVSCSPEMGTSPPYSSVSHFAYGIFFFVRGQYSVKPRKVGHLSFVQSEDPETLTNAHN